MSFTHVKQHRYIRKAIPTGMAFFVTDIVAKR
ncbi:protein of unknown function (fragment) [Brochothrix thermosphacta]